VSGLVGIGPLARLILRRDRWLLPLWAVLPAVIVGGTAAAFTDLYPTAAAREEFAALMAANPGIVAFIGPVHGSSIGALTAWRTAILGVVIAGVASVFTVVRHTRADEAAGRRELLGSTVVGRDAPLAAALLMSAAYAALVGAGVTVGLLVAGQPTPGSIATGASWSGLALVSAGVAALGAQLVDNPRTARGIGGGVLGGFYLIRIIGDTAGGAAAWLSWASPVGWMHAVHPFDGERWAVLLLFASATAVTVAAAFILEARRDLDAGVLPTRPGRPAASPRFGTPLALSLRLHRGAFAGWATVTALYGGIVGGLGPTITSIFEDQPDLREIIERLGGEGVFIDVFLAAGLGLVGLIAGAYAVQAALRIHGEEQSGHAELVLATPVTRGRLLSSHAVIVAAAPASAMLVGGVSAGIAYGAVTGDLVGESMRLTAASTVQIPAILVVGGLTLALFGLAPRAAMRGWDAIVAFFILGQLGAVLGLPQWLMNLSPFTHTPPAPAPHLRLEPLLWLTLAAVALGAVAFAGFRRRDAGAP
jgi:ABC-2 type transport system permease protein